MSNEDRLIDIALHSSGFNTQVDAAVYSFAKGHVFPAKALQSLADSLCAKYALTAEIHGEVLVLYPLNTRAKQPPCICISRSTGQSPSPSAIGTYWSAWSIIQVFDGGADDSGIVAGEGQAAPYRIETKNRSLCV